MDEPNPSIDRLTPEQLADLGRRLTKREPGSHSPSSPIPPRTGDGPAGLSYAQERLWLLQEIAPESPVYNIPLTIQFPHALDVPALERSLAGLLRRHEILRTSFRTRGGEPAQVVRPVCDVKLPVMDLGDLADDQREAHFARSSTDANAKPFELTSDSLLRWILFRFSDSDYRLHIVVHHIVCDGWSLEILVREIKAGYAAETDVAAPLPDAPLQYADFAVWQRRLIESGGLRGDLAWWQDTLRGMPSALELPTDRPRRANHSFAGATQFFTISKRLASTLQSLATAEGVTTFMLLLAAFDVLLQRYTGQTDVIVGTPIANRTKAELERLIGCFVNALVLRTEVAPRMTFRALLRHVRDVTLDAYAHQDVPFEKLVEVMRPDRSHARNPLFQVFFALQNTPTFETGDVGLDPSGEPVPGTAKFELSVALVESNSRLSGAVEYSTELFDHQTITRLIGHYRMLLAAIAEDPNAPIHALPMLTTTELKQLDDWGYHRREVPDACAHHRFERQARATPNAIAVQAPTERVTYAELDARANQLAHHLAGMGVGRGSRVGLCLERSLDVVVAIYGVLKAGAAYVPIDPDYPPERVALMLADSKVGVVLGSRRQLALQGQRTARWLDLDDERASIAKHPTSPLPADVVDDDLCYVIYTSGSTGLPKAAAVTHRGFFNMLHWFITDFQIDARDRVLVVTSLSFDLTQKNYFATLAVGGELHLAPGGPFDPNEVLDEIAGARATLLNCTPSMMYALLEATDEAPRQLETVRCTFLGGEPIDMRRLRRWTSSRWFRGEVVNTYGPTECSDVTTFHRLTSYEKYLDQPVPIGRPIPNVENLVLDASLDRVPLGVVGELYIGGRGLGAGYLNDAGLTASKFLPNPHARDLDEAIYRTGDLVRWRSEGHLEFVGRTDHQLKLRGFRIELGEIEATLSKHPAVRSVVVSAQGHQGPEQALFAYVVPASEVAAPIQNWLRMCREGIVRDRAPIELPNGLAVFHQNRSETEFVYRELFEQDAYLRHGIVLEPGACVFDVGANIGLFALFVALRAPGARVFAFEPIPPIHDTLKLNAQLHDLDLEAFDVALGSSEGSAHFTYYQNATIISGQFAEGAQDREAVRQYLLARERGGIAEADLADILEDRLKTQDFVCSIKTLSQVIRQTGVARIDLLKIDVEKSELDVLLGIEPEHWPLIRQIVVEVHDLEDRAQQIEALLSDRGFEVIAEQDPLLSDTNIRNLYARRKAAVPAAAAAATTAATMVTSDRRAWSSSERLTKELVALAQRSLPHYMVPSRIVLVEALPLTPSGKVDRKQLPGLGVSAISTRTLVAPRSELEQSLAEIWWEVLQRKDIGVLDNFFDLGGHSLLATRVVARIRDRFQVEFSLRRLFDRPTIEGLAIGLVEMLLEREKLATQGGGHVR
jgi:amino acid adenylation domain-containing protein/FkbM family methyltransferase